MRVSLRSAVPIHEFYCADCHAVFNFFARKPDTKKRPKCPRCGRPDLDRKVSRFAISKGRSEPRESDELPADLDEAKMEQVMAEMPRDGEGMDEIEEEMGDLLEEEPGFAESGRSLRQLSKRFKPPEVDDTLYDL
jgi:putative FmdB family regulatory protein